MEVPIAKNILGTIGAVGVRFCPQLDFQTSVM